MDEEQEMQIIKDNIYEYGQTNITMDEYKMIYISGMFGFLSKLVEKDKTGIPKCCKAEFCEGKCENCDREKIEIFKEMMESVKNGEDF